MEQHCPLLDTLGHSPPGSLHPFRSLGAVPQGSSIRGPGWCLVGGRGTGKTPPGAWIQTTAPKSPLPVSCSKEAVT